MRTHAKIDPPKDGFAAAKNLLLAFAAIFICASLFATTKGLNQITTPDLQPEGDFSLSLQIQDKRLPNPYEIQTELGLSNSPQLAAFKPFPPHPHLFTPSTAFLPHPLSL